MGILRPATPGFIVTVVATALLAVVSFCVPYFKSVYFLKATIAVSNVNTSITFGTLGYCSQSGSVSNCTSPSVGYELDINAIVGNNLPIEIPTVVVKWLTYCLVLHIVALGLSAGSAVFGLLAHVREVSMTCCSTCVSGFAAVVALLAFIFDLALFFVAKARINKVEGASAEIGNAIWLTLAAWVLLFFSGCFYTLGRCCISNRSSRDKKKDRDNEANPDHSKYNGGPTHIPGPDQTQMEAIKAEADRKARQKKQEGGLPAFHENGRYTETQPLTGRVSGDNVYLDDDPSSNHYHDLHGIANAQAAPGGGYAPGGYVQAPPGTRAVDDYYNPSASTAYPPQPQRQASGHTLNSSAHAPSNYPPHTTSPPPPMVPQVPYHYMSNAPHTTSPGPIGNQYLSTAPQTAYAGINRQPSSGEEYGHTAGGTTYHSAHDQYVSEYTPYDHSAYPQQTEPNTGYSTQPQSYYTAPSTTPHQTDGYGQNSFPPLQNEPTRDTSYFPPTSPVRGPRAQNSIPTPQPHEQHAPYDAPPVYDDGMSNLPGAWGGKQ